MGPVASQMSNAAYIFIPGALDLLSHGVVAFAVAPTVARTAVTHDPCVHVDEFNR